VVLNQILRLVALLVFLLVSTWSRPGHAYAWMIRHEYSGCATCHTDPSGGFLLTAYGRAQRQTFLSTFGRGAGDAEVDARSEFAFGLVKLPDSVNLGFSQRNLVLYEKPDGSAGTARHVWMQTDARAALDFGKIEAAGSLGFAHEGGLAAAITSRPKDNLVSREFWVGYRFGDAGDDRLRVGRLYLPFGLRTLDHTLYVRNATQTDLDTQQQYGAAFFHQSDSYRFEVMAVAGNYQLRPDVYRARGYSGYVELNPASRLGVGLSSLLTYQGESFNANISGAALRGAHGPFARWAPIPTLALMTEWDVLHEGSTQGASPIVGVAGMVQADWEAVQGVHVAVTPEVYAPDTQQGGVGYRAWLTAAWFPYPHFDLRADAIRARDVFGTAAVNYTLVLGQLHVSL
jgi:hypothetical protein